MKPDKAQKIENMIIQVNFIFYSLSECLNGCYKIQVDEQSLITYLEQMNEGDKPTTTIKVNSFVKIIS